MRSFSIGGGGGAFLGDTGASGFGCELPSAGGAAAGGEDFEFVGSGTGFGVTDAGAPAKVPVPTTVMFPGTSI